MNIRLFGMTRDIAGKAQIVLNVADAKGIRTVGELKAHLVAEYPEFSRLSSLAVAVNRAYAADETTVGEADEIALIPPVSGG